MISKSFWLYSISLIIAIGLYQADGSENTEIVVNIINDSTIDLNSEERLIRAYVEVINFDPTDGYYYMEIIQSSSGISISQQEILIREKGNDLAGASVAYMIDEEEILENTNALTGNYEIVIRTEHGDYIGKTNFSIIGADDRTNSPQTDNENQINENNDVSNNDQTVQENGGKIESSTPKEIDNAKKLPEWVSTIFTLYSEKKISENELLEAIRFLIVQKIIVV